MDEFLEQFLIESRELVDQATDDLLALEKAPADVERFDDAFRAFHTLKGGAGIVEFAAMQEALHCAEIDLRPARIEHVFTAPIPQDMREFCAARGIQALALPA